MTRTKHLPVDKDGKIKKEFVANGTKYFIRAAEESFSILRLAEFQKWSIVLQHGKSHQEQYEAWNRLVKMIDRAATGTGYADVAAYALSQRQNLLNIVNSKYDAAMYLCTLFIVRENEDITRWNRAEAQEKIEDWNTAGYSPFDFFLLSMQASPELKSLFQKQLNQMQTNMS